MHNSTLKFLNSYMSHTKMDLIQRGASQVYSVSRDIPDRIQRWRGVPFLQYKNSCFFGAINKTEVHKIDIKIEVEVSSWLWLD